MAIEVKGRLSLDGSGWDNALRTAESQVARFGGGVLSNLKGQIAGAFSAGAIEEFARHIIEYGAQIAASANQFDITTDEVQKLTIAAGHVKLEFEDIATAIDKIGKLRREAGTHEGEALKEMEKWGITLDNVRDPLLRNIDLMALMQAKIEELGHTAEGRQELRDFFGRSGGRMIAVLEELKKSSPIKLVDEKQVEQLSEIDKKFQDIWTTIRNFGAAGVVAFLGDEEGTDEDKAAIHELFGKPGPKNTDSFVKAHSGAAGDHTPEMDSTGVTPAAAQIFPYKPNKELLEELAKAQRRNELEGLTNEQKILELTKERAEILAKIKTDTGDDILKDKIKVTNLDTEIKGLKQTHTNLGFKSGNALINTGNFLGASPRQIVAIGEVTNHYLKQIADNTNPNSGSKNGNLTGSGFSSN